jgi:hypothetical protein
MTYFNIFTGITEAQLKHQYRELAKVEHPDKFETLGEEAVAAAKLKFQEIQDEYNKEMLKVKYPYIKIVDTKMWGSVRAGADTMLENLGLTKLDELFPEYLCSLIDLINVPVLEKHKPILKLFIRTATPKVDDAATVIFDFFTSLLNKIDKK